MIPLFGGFMKVIAFNHDKLVGRASFFYGKGNGQPKAIQHVHNMISTLSDKGPYLG